MQDKQNVWAHGSVDGFSQTPLHRGHKIQDLSFSRDSRMDAVVLCASRRSFTGEGGARFEALGMVVANSVDAQSCVRILARTMCARSQRNAVLSTLPCLLEEASLLSRPP